MRNRLVAALVTLGTAAIVAATAPDPPLASAVSADDCYRIWAEAEKEGSRYRHLVYVRNDCEYWLECSLWTNANPQPPKMVTVGPGTTERVETAGDSENDSPKGFGSCRRK
jgi:hypothetical protein